MLFGDVQAALDQGLLPERFARPIKTAWDQAEDLPPGRYPLEGEDFFMVQTYDTKPSQEGRFEAHRNFIDVQIVLEGREHLYVAPAGELDQWLPFDPEHDIGFSQSQAEGSALPMLPGCFALLFPRDAHKPGCHAGEKSAVRKLVLKLKG